MDHYELQVVGELKEWKRRLTRRSGMMKRISKKTQIRANQFIPEKVHQLMTESIKTMVKAAVTGSIITTKQHLYHGLSLAEADELAQKKIGSYQKAGIVEGAGTGAGGILLGLADFPLLLSIEMKLLFEIAAIYGFDTQKYDERLYILHIFQLAFASDEVRRETFAIIEDWEARKPLLMDMDWRKFQQEYRDYIDLAKLFQLVPGIGAFVGAYANNSILKILGETAMNAYRLRLLSNLNRLP
ncbi:EcsC family protein [Bacillus rubiinfantis]|uniref:EcsC family protein n=1 Tax=Bacillus rubiinfantis TaxID=1499680 RepID=UPI0005A7A1CC|nr:EcsC family protein [Bacillus rubiinfantis]